MLVFFEVLPSSLLLLVVVEYTKVLLRSTYSSSWCFFATHTLSIPH
jgi:hypothetical protein